jgi:hypothetical protein
LQNRQVDAAFSALQNEVDATALRFRSHQDALNYAAHCVEKANRRLALQNWFGMVDNYVVGNLYVRVPFGRFGRAVDYDFCFLGQRRRSEFHVGHLGIDVNSDRGFPEIHRNKNSVFFGIRECIQCPKGVVPSFVWLEPFKERANLKGEIVFQAVDSVRPKIDVFGERERSKIIGISVGTMPHSDGVSHLIQAGPEIANGIEHNTGNIIGESFTKAEYLQIISGISITLDNMGVGLIWRKDLDCVFQIRNMVICSTQDAFGTGEDITHDEIRPNERPQLSESSAAFSDHTT